MGQETHLILCDPTHTDPLKGSVSPNQHGRVVRERKPDEGQVLRKPSNVFPRVEPIVHPTRLHTPDTIPGAIPWRDAKLGRKPNDVTGQALTGRIG